VPGWQDVLETAAKAGRALEMGYIGVDMVLDAAGRPVVLEANARPGLSIQLANRAGLWERIRRIEPSPARNGGGAPRPTDAPNGLTGRAAWADSAAEGREPRRASGGEPDEEANRTPQPLR
jgi:carbamoylphosphate synthase large subunit